MDKMREEFEKWYEDNVSPAFRPESRAYNSGHAVFGSDVLAAFQVGYQAATKEEVLAERERAQRIFADMLKYKEALEFIADHAEPCGQLTIANGWIDAFKDTAKQVLKR
jgi:hypothetical protein